MVDYRKAEVADLNIVTQPDLDGLAGERLRSFAIRLAQETLPEDAIREMVKREASWAKQTPLLNGQTHAYEAAARLLADLRLLKWRVRADVYGIELESPPSPRFTARSPGAIREAKDAVRRELSPALLEQFADPLVRRFIDDLECPPPGSRRRSIRSLIADGSELLDRLEPSITAAPGTRAAALEHAIQPYLQLVPGEGDSVVHDEFSGIPLSDVWRYFRLTWSIPQTAIPGRQMFYLVRDRAHPSHAIIGIAALGNSPLVSPLRDEVIGWTPARFTRRLLEGASMHDASVLEYLLLHLEALVSGGIAEIDQAGLVSAAELAAPTDDVVARLQRRANEFASRREGALREVADAARAGVPLALQETEQSDYGLPPVSRAVLALEGKAAPVDTPETLARRLLVAKKRAFELARLLRARLALGRHRTALGNPATVASVIHDEEVQFAISTALLCAKSDRIGTNILEVTTCGAIAPYDHLLGGKLVALLLLSPEVADDYRSRYSDRPAIISSQLKNAERTKDCTIAWLNTTSLYVLGASQYERLRLPAGTISQDQPELRYVHIGDTEGYGTVQFSEATVQAVQAALQERHEFRGVNSIFGEGFSPKFRKMRDGMMALGFNPTVLMRHDQQRRMYAVPMWSGAGEFLRGEAKRTPDYIRNPALFRSATERIAAFWRARWLSARLNYRPALDNVRIAGSWSLSERVEHLPINERSLKSRSRTAGGSGGGSNPPGRPDRPKGVRFWRELAQAGPEACADEISVEQLDRLHVPQSLDTFLVERVSRGLSIVLTGSAGDGKTHALRRLEAELRRLGAVVETDATAAMKPADASPILRQWKNATRDGRPFCIAANEYPLHLLRAAGRDFPPLVEVARQCDHRLVYSSVVSPEEDAREKVLVVDLSLRNPLARGFADALLEKLLSQPELSLSAQEEPEGDLAWNLHHLQHSTVRERLLDLLARLAGTGSRATVRELWIWMARLLLGDGLEDRKPVRSPGRWYSSRLFDVDPRFVLSGLLRRFADPSAHSHPRWDLRLDGPGVSDGWLLQAPMLLGLDREQFAALKRRFYFEHSHGQEVLSLDGAPGQGLLAVLRQTGPVEPTFKNFVIESINKAYCPELFPAMSTQLFLWIGHRFQEQPSHGHVANQSVSEAELELCRPRIPMRLRGAFDYQPDHMVLEYRHSAAPPARLRLDYPLFVALEKLSQGLPRQLLPDRELNRLDAFLEQLRRADVPRRRNFFIHSHDDRTTAQVTLTPDLKAYEGVRLK